MSKNDGWIAPKGRPRALGVCALLLAGAASAIVPIAGAVEEIGFTPIASIYRQDFEFGSAGWVAGGVASSWELGVPSEIGGPESAFSGLRAWSTNLYGPYNKNECSYVSSPALTIPPRGARIGTDQVSAARLFFHQWVSTEMAYDAGVVQVSNDGGRSWRTMDVPGGGAVINAARACVAPNAAPDEIVRGWSGPRPDDWTEGAVDLTLYLGQSVHVRFVFGSDESQERIGWLIDDVRLQVGAGS